jgi:hypothetical protein
VDAARYGLLYTAAQRFNEFHWGDKSRLTREIARAVLIWQKLQIDEYGKITEFSVTNASEAPQSVVRQIEEQIGGWNSCPVSLKANRRPCCTWSRRFRDRGVGMKERLRPGRSRQSDFVDRPEWPWSPSTSGA